jgi:hypothetical protein
VILWLIENEGLAALGAKQQAEKDRTLLASRKVVEILSRIATATLNLDSWAVGTQQQLQFEGRRPTSHSVDRLRGKDRIALIKEGEELIRSVQHLIGEPTRVDVWHLGKQAVKASAQGNVQGNEKIIRLPKWRLGTPISPASKPSAQQLDIPLISQISGSWSQNESGAARTRTWNRRFWRPVP